MYKLVYFPSLYSADLFCDRRGFFLYNDNSKVNLSQKPLLQLEFLLRTCHQGNWVVDMCCGSGSGLIAALRMGFPVAGFDSNQTQVDAAKRRVSLFAQQEVTPQAFARNQHVALDAWSHLCCQNHFSPWLTLRTWLFFPFVMLTGLLTKKLNFVFAKWCCSFGRKVHGSFWFRTGFGWVGVWPPRRWRLWRHGLCCRRCWRRWVIQHFFYINRQPFAGCCWVDE